MLRSISQFMKHLVSHILDSHFHGGSFCTPFSKQIFSDTSRLQRWLDIEAALAHSQADLHIIPKEAAREISENADIEKLDWEKMQAEMQKSEHSLVPLLRAVQRLCKKDCGQYIHYGATTQDIQDTGQMLAMKSVHNRVKQDVRDLLSSLKLLAQQHRQTVLTGRTHAQAALPITFGLKVANWYDELYRNLERIESSESRIFVTELFGACGTMAAFGGLGIELLEKVSEKLGLFSPNTSWHVARDRVVEFVCHMAILAGCLARIADEIRTLKRPEFGELSFVWHEGVMGSSTGAIQNFAYGE